MSRSFLKAAVISLMITFAMPIVTTPAAAMEKTDIAKKKKAKKSPCGKEQCMKAVPVK